MSGKRCAYITSTKGLQHQISEDFEECGLVDIRGKGNYRCKIMQNGMCDEGQCNIGFHCDYQVHGCYYFDAYNRAKNANFVVTNYAKWIIDGTKDEEDGLGKFDLLILDEAHNAPDELSSALSFMILRGEIESLLDIRAPWDSENPKVWKDWFIGSASLALQAKLAAVKTEGLKHPDSALARYYRSLRKLAKVMKPIADVDDLWSVEVTKKGAAFSPIWPARHRERLFQGIPQVVLLSATVRRKTAHLLGIKDEDLDFYDYDSVFPVKSRPVIHVPTIRVNFRTDESQMRLWCDRIDQIIRGRLDRKGIVHTVSYDRRTLIVKHSDHRDIIYTHDTGTTASVVERFKNSDPPAVLVSPSVSTGYDFHGDLCRYQIIGKIAFPDTRNKITAVRCKADADYGPYIAMQELVQSCGRGVRSAEDFCETFIIDDNWAWVQHRYKHLLPKWFLQACWKASTIPDPPGIE
jgi:Rad3-related DNA helicase